MNRNTNMVAAIDIGTTKIAAIIGEKNSKGVIEIIGYGSVKSEGVQRGVVSNIEQTVKSILAAKEQAEQQAQVKITDAYVGIAGQHIRSTHERGYINRDSNDTEISQNDIDRLVGDMRKMPIEIGEEILHVLPQNFVVNKESGIKDPRGMSGKRLEANFHIVINDTAAANNIKKCVTRAGINVKELILEPLASATSVLSDDEKEAGVALVDIGGGTTDVAVFYDGIIRHTSVIPFGGNIVTVDISEGCGILKKYAEKLKIEFGSSLVQETHENKVVSIPGISGRPPKEISFKNLAHIIQARMEEIIAEVCFQIESSGMMQQLKAGIVLTGGGSLLDNLQQLVAFKTGMYVRVGLPNQRIKSDIVEEINKPTYATSIGLMLMGFEKGDNCCAKQQKVEKKIEKTEKIEIEKEAEKTKKIKEIKDDKKKPRVVATLFDKLGDFFEVNDEKM